MNFFSIDSPLYKFMSRLFDMFKLNLMWLIFSLPIVTMGAATTAAYTVTLKMVDDEEGYIAAPFWQAFKENLKKGSLVGIILEFAAYAIYLDFQLYHAANKYNTMFLIVGVIAVFLLYMHMIYAFPLLARYENTIINTLRNSYSIAAKYLGRTAFLTVILLFEIVFFFWNWKMAFLGVLFCPACLMLTISGFAKNFFSRIESENAMVEEESEEDVEEEPEEYTEDDAEDDELAGNLDDESEE